MVTVSAVLEEIWRRNPAVMVFVVESATRPTVVRSKERVMVILPSRPLSQQELRALLSKL